MTQFFDSGRDIITARASGITSATNVQRFHNVPAGAAIKIYPTSAGTAAVFSTFTQRAVSDLDGAAGIIASTNASWDKWEAGDVTAKTVSQVNVPLATVALVVTSGTWVIEVIAK